MNELTLSEAGLGELLHGSSSLLPSMTRDIYLTRMSVVGTRYIGDADHLVKELPAGSRVTLLHEADNRFDEKAVIVIDAKGRKLGYIPRAQNAVIAALLDAGKFFYGIVRDQPQKYDDESDTSAYRFRIDLYMSELIGPGEPSELPRQGSRGSYAVIAVDISEERNRIRGISAIKVINGEDRGHFQRKLSSDEDGESLRRMMEEFDAFAGFLPLVGHGLGGSMLRTIEESYGVVLGKAFSNHVTDTQRLARICLPELDDVSLLSCAEELGIEVGDAESELMRLCVITWKLYCRLERSELERKQDPAKRMMLLSSLCRDGKIRPSLCRDLEQAGIILLGDLMDRSEANLMKIQGIGPERLGSLKKLAEECGVSLAKEDYECSVVRLEMPSNLSALEERSVNTALQLKSAEERERIKLLPPDERSRIVSEEIDRLIGIFRQRGDEDTVVSIKMLGGLAGYMGDYSDAGFSQLDSADEEKRNITNGYMILGHYYLAWHDGKLRKNAGGSMLRVCVRLAQGILAEAIMDGASAEDRAGAAGVLLREAVTHACRAPQTEETAEILETLGSAFYEGEYTPEDGLTIRIEQSFEDAYKAFYYAEQCGSVSAGKMMETVLKAAANT